MKLATRQLQVPKYTTTVILKKQTIFLCIDFKVKPMYFLVSSFKPTFARLLAKDSKICSVELTGAGHFIGLIVA